eukprot:TRINITY_DN20580_c1_g1_i3.p2 TRINITY_DN20580_c1_g1~~TRINITY_DN20580_c1_g1_i3.p2  ORF type:complete len:164 (-),score=13.54 TRINITY_DN20580_c1_g1_i3:75-566(-)
MPPNVRHHHRQPAQNAVDAKVAQGLQRLRELEDELRGGMATVHPVVVHRVVSFALDLLLGVHEQHEVVPHHPQHVGYHREHAELQEVGVLILVHHVTIFITRLQMALGVPAQGVGDEGGVDVDEERGELVEGVQHERVAHGWNRPEQGPRVVSKDHLEDRCWY